MKMAVYKAKFKLYLVREFTDFLQLLDASGVANRLWTTLF